MIVVLAVVLVAVGAGAVAFAVSVSQTTSADPIDPSAEERALVRWLAGRPRLDGFLRRRFDRRARGGFLLTVSFLVVLVVGVVIGVLLEMIDEGTGLARFDESVARWGSEHATSDAVHVIEAITQLGGTIVVVPVLGLVAGFDYVRRRNAEVFAFVAAVGLGVVVLNNILKLIVDRDRPDVLQLVSAAGSSFPSGHSATAAATWSAVALILGRGQSRRVRALLAAGAAVIAVAVAISRTLLGVHWVTDVVAGLFVGWGWFLLVAIAFGGRAQRLGDPTSSLPQGLGLPTATDVRAGEERARRS